MSSAVAYFLEPHPHPRAPWLGGPLVCVCDRPRPVPVYLFDTIRIADAYECAHCGRKVVP